jgi:hypothetical protein
MVGLLAWRRRMLRNFQHSPGAEARSFIASEAIDMGGEMVGRMGLEPTTGGL